MPFAGKLVRSLVIAVVLASGVAWLLAERTFPLTAAQVRTLRLWLSVGVALESLAVVIVVLWLSAPIRRVAARGRAVTEPEAVAAALCARHLPGRVAALLCALGAVTTVATVFTLVRRVLAMDFAFAGGVLGVAAFFFCAIVGWSL